MAESLIAADFRFTSPLDSALDRETYFRRCWPNSDAMRAVQIIEALDGEDQAVVIYEVETEGKRFRNCERHTSRGDQLLSVEVYFGWDLPHPAAPRSLRGGRQGSHEMIDQSRGKPAQ